MELFRRVQWLIGMTWVLVLAASALLTLDLLVYSNAWFGLAAALLLVLAAGALVWLLTESRATRTLERERFRELFTLLGDGIIVMNPRRTITFMNPAAVRMTGWTMEETIPYCRFCQHREVPPGQERCLLASDPSRSYFESQLPTKTGGWVDVGMSRTFLLPRGSSRNRDMVITIRDVTREKQEEELRLSRRLTHHTLKVQEEERKRLSQELHDGVSQTLYAISLAMEHLSRRVQDVPVKEKIVQLQDQVRASIDEIRALSRTLYPAVLYSLGLVAALRSLAEALSTPHRTVTFTTDFSQEAPFSPEVSAHLYRIVQEAVHNAILHGRADDIVIDLKRQASRAVLRVEDNGRGFRLGLREDITGYGLRNMEERSRAIQSNFRVFSSPGAGTAIQLELPLMTGAAGVSITSVEALNAQPASADIENP
ncbi:histidine kinase [Alicyclobacillus tolerans]|uniref:sensor histidine kinase n=1 Tax=Alicyclobacillus tolerans TaxID=90970 RepID=UPI001F021E97|nr:sensor histidine kinase [Alicyclobacillus tolerans]MCF8566101.1 histidine kinase [Alicyclobacillus tolerans]